MTVLSEVLQALEPFKTLLSVTEEGDYIKVQPLHYIEPPVFSDIGRTMHKYNAEYIKAGKQTHWRILKAEANPKLSLAMNHIQKAKELATQLLKELEQAGY